ncbi:beta propeller repeat protein [Niabella drilacis]|uniref:BNR/Asp-box repeat-containing protein n=1 Tax=Niabella drilacis (strain DSM 25811 / CCM 8410 / CCUG 62505 / LMG 26954 / E90) TaxID=1285928 RepID=A0A1G6RHN4_NIADE|nr:sialidase family protein [Niabella drilacis]SDD04169.1 hypothetical protein SAMN04487894_105288 [Niabella drilacis]
MKPFNNSLSFCTHCVLKKTIFYAAFAALFLIVACKRDFSKERESANRGAGPRALTAMIPQIKPLPVVLKAEWNPPNYYEPGDHTQHMQGIAYSEADPNRIYMGQDVSNIWVSTNFGQRWSTLKCGGLNSNFVMSVEADPVNKNRILAAVNCRPYAEINSNYQGIYLSTNGGVSWSIAGNGGRTTLSAVRSSTKLFAYAPTSKNGTMAARWYAAFGEGHDSIPAQDGFLTSGDGGASWVQVRNLPRSTYGENIRGIKVHKTNANQVFLYGSAGLFKITNATAASGTVYKLSNDVDAAGKLPPGDIMGSLYQSDNGDTLIVAVVKKGVYKSANGGTSWAAILQWTDINYCYVSEKNSNKIVATPVSNAHQIQISDNGGSGWWSPATADVHYRPGYDSAWNNKLGGTYAHVLFNPGNGSIFMHSKSKNYISTDGGHRWDPSDNYYNGSSHSSINEDQMFDPNTPDRFCYFMVDRGPVVSTLRGRWFNEFAKPGGAGQTCIGGALQPGTQVILATVGMNGVGQLLRSTDNGGSWSVILPESKNRWVVGFSLQKTNVCYQWRERSDDDGASWHPMSDMPAGSVLCGISRTNGDIIYAMKLESDGNTRKIFRSANQGKVGSWSTNPIIESTWDLTVPGKSTEFVFKVHPQNNNIVYTSSANGEITKWDLSNGTSTDLDIIPGSAAAGTDYIHRFAIDPRNPDIMYAINQRANTGNKFFRSVNGGASWENLSNYIPQGSVNGLAVSPVTGEVYLSGENGSLVMLPPDNVSTNTAFAAVPYTMHHITTFPY